MRYTSCAAALLTGIALLPSVAHATYISSTPDPFAGGVITVTYPAIQHRLFGYVQTFDFVNIVETSNNIIGGNDVLDYNAVLNSIYYTDPTLTKVQSMNATPGNFQVTVLGRTSSLQLGTFDFQFDFVNFNGPIGGYNVKRRLYPGFDSGGTLTTSAGPGLGQYTIDVSGQFRFEFSANGGPFADTGISSLSVGSQAASTVPEPSSYALLIVGFSGIGFLARRRKHLKSPPLSSSFLPAGFPAM